VAVKWRWLLLLLLYVIITITTSNDAVRDHHDVDVWRQRRDGKAERGADSAEHRDRTAAKLVDERTSQRRWSHHISLRLWVWQKFLAEIFPKFMSKFPEISRLKKVLA